MSKLKESNVQTSSWVTLYVCLDVHQNQAHVNIGKYMTNCLAYTVSLQFREPIKVIK